ATSGCYRRCSDASFARPSRRMLRLTVRPGKHNSRRSTTRFVVAVERPPMASTSAARTLRTLKVSAAEAARCERWTCQATNTPTTSGRQLTAIAGADRRNFSRALIREPPDGGNEGGSPSYARPGGGNKTGSAGHAAARENLDELDGNGGESGVFALTSQPI